MVDGLDVLFRVALAILRGNEQELLQCDSIPAVYVALESLPNRMWRSDKLIKVSYLSILLCLQAQDFLVGSARWSCAVLWCTRRLSSDEKHILKPLENYHSMHSAL